MIAFLFRGDASDPKVGVGLAVAVLPAVVLPPPELEDHDLPPSILGGDLGRNRRAFHQGLPHFGAVAADQKNLAQGDRIALVSGELLDPERLPLGNSVLLPARPDDCVHGLNPSPPRAPIPARTPG